MKETLEYVGKGSLFNVEPYSQNGVDTKFYLNDGESETVHLQNIKLDKDTRIEINTLPQDISLFNVKVFSLIENVPEKDTVLIRFVSNLGGEIIKDITEEMNRNALDNPQLLEIINELQSNANLNEEGQLTTNAWYDSLPCVGNGCCIIKEALYPGGTPNFPLPYNWCGANCGSGTPVNSTDTCCRTHDYCYGSFKSYPDRCACDRNLIKCVSGKGTRAAGLISIAFKAKMATGGRCK
ncbi:hypothetical protein [Clostridium sp. UBA1652]|uniref:hypothetical protein n=1 Tax=Clostridium sp. UBA1652 TaxID=1946348 RepID=UPI00257F3DC1|nr:hypothetical protein [Clostridium sp. UBA1652]